MKTVEETAGNDALTEWLEHPVTAWFAQVIQTRADEAVVNRANVFYPGEPNKTQELISRLNGAVDELNAIWHSLNEVRSDSEIDPLNYLMVEAESE